jgi:hypothetical protein
MSDLNYLDPTRTVRLLRAKSHELTAGLDGMEWTEPLDYVRADIALIADLLAGFIEYVENKDVTPPEGDPLGYLRARGAITPSPPTGAR